MSRGSRTSRRLVAWLALSLLCVIPGASFAQSGMVRDYISVIGPRTSYPYVSAVTDRFGMRTRFKFPRIEITDTPTAFKLICGGEGSEFPDLALANREMTAGEKQACSRRGVQNLSSLHLGYDAIALAAFETGFDETLTPRSLFLALAKSVPDPAQEEKEGQDAGITTPLVANPYHRWNQIDPSLPDQPITISLPPRASVQFDLFQQILLAGCRAVPWFAAFEEQNPDQFNRQCTDLREDDAIIPFDRELDKMLQEETFPPGRLIVVPQASLEKFSSSLHPIPQAGIAPTIEGINSGDYSGARPVYIYIRNDQISNIPGLRQFITEFTGDKAIGENGYLRETGFVPLTEEHRSEVATLLTDIVRIRQTTREEGNGKAGAGQGSPRAQLRDIDMGFWNRIRRSDDPDLVKLYIDLMPSGLFADRARDVEKRLRRRDQDGDQVPDYRDLCPGTAKGAAVTDQGCEPDQDRDGIPDVSDACPESPADTLVGADGCFPDRDGDGIADPVDHCSRTSEGVAVDDTGCAPDLDADGIPDHADQCPDSKPGEVVGPNGCFPDRDADSIADSEDLCPRTPDGIEVDATGCGPDQDGDGIADHADQCPDSKPEEVVGLNGCSPDQDSDGIADYLDQCHGTPAGAGVDDRGCWVLEGLIFPAGKASLQNVDLELLETVATILIANPELRVEIQGHSDNSGQRDKNINLSKERAEAVAGFLIKKDIAADRISAKGFGPDYPVASNDTEDGRNRNRRVEIRTLPPLPERKESDAP